MSPSRNREKNMFIIHFLNTIYPLGSSLRFYLKDKIKSCSFSKNEIVSREGEICDKLYLIKTGMVRGYFMSDSNEITTWIDAENEIFTSITGFFRNEKSREFIQCIEDTQCDYLTYEDFKYCLMNFPEMRHINRIMMEEYYLLAENRVFLARIPNAQKRLNYFMETHKPQIVKRIPKKYLASFLAMRPETLSRLLKDHQ